MKEKDNIENFFKKRLNDNRQFDFRESDWSKMESKLDAMGMSSSVGVFETLFSKSWIWIVTTVIAAFVLGWWANDSFRESGVSQESKSIDAQKSKSTVDREIANFEHASAQHLRSNSIAENNNETDAIGITSESNATFKNEIINSDQIKSELQTEANDIIKSETIFTQKILNNNNFKKINQEEVLSNNTIENKPPNKTQKDLTSPSDANNHPTDFTKETLTSNSLETAKKYETVANNEIRNSIINQYSSKEKEMIKGHSTQEKVVQKSILSFVEYKKQALVNHGQSIYKLEYNQSMLSKKKDTIIELSNKDRPEKIINESNNLYSRWSVGISYAPDANSVGLGQRLSVTNKFSFQLYYKLGNRFSISTGLAYSKKKYETEGKNYTPPEGYWKESTNGILPKDIDGICTVIDIPLNLTYLWNPKKKFRLLTTFGISNYILLDEDYQYEFESVNPFSATGWKTEDNTNVFFGLANMSVAAAWNINKKLEFQIEPYLKVPIKKIGFGNVPLYSSGVYFRLKIKFISKKKSINILKDPD